MDRPCELDGSIHPDYNAWFDAYTDEELQLVHLKLAQGDLITPLKIGGCYHNFRFENGAFYRHTITWNNKHFCVEIRGDRKTYGYGLFTDEDSPEKLVHALNTGNALVGNESRYEFVKIGEDKSIIIRPI